MCEAAFCTFCKASFGIDMVPEGLKKVASILRRTTTLGSAGNEVQIPYFAVSAYLRLTLAV